MATFPMNIAPTYLYPELLSAVAVWALLSLEILICFLEAAMIGWLYKKDFTSSLKISVTNNFLSFVTGTPILAFVSFLLRPMYHIMETSIYLGSRLNYYSPLIGIMLFAYAFLLNFLIEAYTTYRQLKKETPLSRCTINSVAINSLSYPFMVLPLLPLFTSVLN